MRELENDWGDHLDVRYFLAEKLSALHGQKVLDIGCGKGYLLAIIPEENEKFGIDVNDASLQRARGRNPLAHIAKANMLDLPFDDETFDFAYMANTLPHADFQMPGNRQADQQKAIAESARVLKPGGTFFLTTPNNARYHTVKETYDELDALLKPLFVGRIQGWNPFPSWPYFIPNRVLKKIPGWHHLLGLICQRTFLARRSKFFYVEAHKR